MHSDTFDIIPYEDIKGNWKKLGAGSFGNVYKGNYLGIDVAIKEVLPSTDYDVHKYFEREWRLMKECRHPNICLFIGLSYAPKPDDRVFIVSEFIDNGNLRSYIHDKTKPFPWRLRISFAVDIARAVAYLHARNCIHRDLKGENLLVTSNGRLKVTDFGFARIAARNEEESKRLTFCGTDSYMSPEILLGHEFDLPTDVFSLGIIFCEIASRRLAGDNFCKRYPPSFSIDGEEVSKSVTLGCPAEFVQLCYECLSIEPSQRPTTREILNRLRMVEAEVLSRPDEDVQTHVGSVRFMNDFTRATPAPRIPSFNQEIANDFNITDISDDDSDEEFSRATNGLFHADVGSRLRSSADSHHPLLGTDSYTSNSDYSTAVIRANSVRQAYSTHTPALSSILTIRPPIIANDLESAIDPHPVGDPNPLGTSSIASIASADSYHTVLSSPTSSALATEGSTVYPMDRNSFIPLVHRFTLIKSGTKPKRTSRNGLLANASNESSGWNPLGLLFSSGLLIGKCDVCNKRLGWKPVLECDDCGLRVHVKCDEIAPRDCGTRSMTYTIRPSDPPSSHVT